MNSILSYIGMLILPGSVLLIAGGIARLRTVLAFRNSSALTTGRIVDVTRDRDSMGKHVYLPIVEFRVGKKRRFQGVVGSRYRAQITVGEAVGVRYLPENPEIARIDSIEHLYGDALSMIGTGFIFTCAALFLLGRLLPAAQLFSVWKIAN